jgi:arginyl-tRNA synthetase
MSYDMSHLFAEIQNKINDLINAFQNDGLLPEDIDYSRVAVEPPRDRTHGDMACNAAMILSKQAKMPPRDLAAKFIEKIEAWDEVEKTEIAGPGFINITFKPDFWLDEVKAIHLAGNHYGKSDVGAGALVNVEFISANPTGPLHAAHARGAVFGDVLSSLLEFTNHKVVREYYTNDSGGQIVTLAKSLYLRYEEVCGKGEAVIPEGYYPGAYLIEAAKKLKDEVGEKFLDQAEKEWLEPVSRFAVKAMMEDIKKDIAHMGIKMDVYTSEDELVKGGAVDRAFEFLEKQGLTYVGVLPPPKGEKPEGWEERPQTLFKATEFGDDIDRPFKKSDGSWTYFAKDIAYHYDKYCRGAKQMINVLGADHAGYVKRIKSATKAVTGGEADLDVKVYQLVHLFDQGKAVKMSKRAGNFVTAEDVVNKVGKDVLRFIMLSRRNDQTLDFDFAEVTKRSKENPVFYVQYAYARIKSVFRHADELLGVGYSFDDAYPELGESPEIMDMIKQLANWPRIVETAALAHEPHRLVFALIDLSASFHHLWHLGKENAVLRFLYPDDKEKTLSRLYLLRAIAFILESGFSILGIELKEEM